MINADNITPMLQTVLQSLQNLCALDKTALDLLKKYQIIIILKWKMSK